MATYKQPTGFLYANWHALSSRLLVHWTLGRGRTVEESSTQPAQPIVLYEYNGCPFCQRLRAVVSELDLDATVYPTPRVTIKGYARTGESRYRPVVAEKAGEVMFPFMEDPNTGISLLDSEAIMDYLRVTYGGGALPRAFSALPISQLMLRSLRLSMYFGVLRVPGHLPAQPLELFAAQGNPRCIPVFDALSCLELPYHWKTCALGSRKLGELRDRSGSDQLPYLTDPNTGFSSNNSRRIVAYLYETYQAGNIPDETIRDYSTEGASSRHGTLG